MKPTFFATPEAFRKWLAKNHASADELYVGFYKKGSGKPSLTWPESVDQALCFGWIDGVRKSLGDDSYVIRFTPRKAKSNWSEVNIKRARELVEQGLMQDAGLRAFEARDASREKSYSFEREHAAFDEGLEKKFRAKKRAYEFFQAQPPGYRRIVTHWIMSAKQQATRERRLATLIERSAEGKRIDFMRPNG